jgi:dihydrolipoamide dehydrogenase
MSSLGNLFGRSQSPKNLTSSPLSSGPGDPVATDFNSASPAPNASKTASPSSFDVIIIGGGPGGYVAAIRASQLGLRTALVESHDLGGVCLNWGCIPTKALLKSAQIFDYTHKMSSMGIRSGSDIVADIQAMVSRSRAVAKGLSQGIEGLMRKNKISVIRGRARLMGVKQGEDHRVSVEPVVAAHGTETPQSAPSILKAPHVILATGARARTIFAPELEVWTAREAMVPQSLPSRLLVVGAGAIGIEFASFYAALGTQVTVVELAERILPQEDSEIAELARKAFEKRGITFYTGHKVAHIARAQADKNHPEAIYTATIVANEGQQNSLSWQGDAVLEAVGVIANTEDLGLEVAGVRVSGGAIETDPATLMTSCQGIYAIGDVAGGPWLAHKASHEGLLCVEGIAHRQAPVAGQANPGGPTQPSHSLDGRHLEINPGHGLGLDRQRIPGCVYSSPQIASLGLSESAARQAGLAIQVGRFPFSANGQALAQDEPTGLVKVIFDQETGELLGAHLLGADVSEMISTLAVAQALEGTIDDLKSVIFPHPTKSEAIHEAVLDACGIALHR